MIAEEAGNLGLLFNVIDSGTSNFVPGSCRRNDLLLTVSTNGKVRRLLNK